MDEQKRPRSREKKVVSEGKGVQKKGQGLGTGPLNNTGSYADRREQEQARPAQRPAARPQQSRPTQGAGFPFGQSGPQQSRPSQGAGFPFGQSGQQQRPQQSRPGQGAGFPFGQSSRPAGQSGQQQRPQQSRPSQGAGFPFGQSSRPAGQSGQQQRPQQSGSGQPMNTRRSSTVQPGQRAGGGSGCSSKIFLAVIALVVLLGGGKLSGLFGGGDTSLFGGGDTSLPAAGNTSATYSGSQSGSYGTTDSSPLTGSSQGSTGMDDLLTLLWGSDTSPYDFTGDPLSLLTGGSSSQDSLSLGGGTSSGSSAGGTSSGTQSSSSGTQSSSSASSSSSSGNGGANLSVSPKAREKYTTVRGNGKDQVTILVYLCGTDLESQNGMGTSDLKEMVQASFGKNVNLIVYTGGCRRWRNNVVSSSVNQIYQISDGKLYCLEKDLGNASMISPKTLTSFIRYGAEHFPANRMCLILWDHGGGSVSGYGYDEKYPSSGAMSLAGINTALKDAGQKFDFIGFDACLMATVENGLMLSQYADYMIASEETEPGVGWYYTNWLNRLGKNTSLSTVEIGKQIADDFVEVCNRQCRGQGTTLSVVDLAELQATVPAELTSFSRGTNELIQKQEYKAVATARSKTREFAQQTRIDQIDLVHFARNLGTDEGKKLVKALQGAVKYNRTGGNISNAYGLSIYFPYKRTNKVKQMVSTYQAIGMDEEYARCIQEFASLEMSGQVAAGGFGSQDVSGFLSGYDSQSIGTGSLLNSLLGGSAGGYGGGIPSSAGDMTDLLGGLFGGSYGGTSAGDPFGFFTGRSLTAESAAEYLSTHHLDASALVWDGDRITLPEAQWGEVDSLVRNVFVDDGEGYIDLGTDSEFTLEGNALTDDFDGTWLSIDRQPIAYYYLGTVDDGENYSISGYSPALLNGTRVNLMIVFDNDHPYGFIAGAAPVYVRGETEAQAKNLIGIGEGDVLQFLCEYYDYDGKYQDSYRLWDPLTLGAETEIANTPIGDGVKKVTYCFTDFYQQRYWTPARIY